MSMLTRYCCRLRLHSLSKFGCDFLGRALARSSFGSKSGTEDSKNYSEPDSPFVEPEPIDGVQKEDWYCDGKLVFTFDHTDKINENYNWSAFEKAFGVDKLHDLDMEKWEFPSSAVIEEYEETEETEETEGTGDAEDLDPTFEEITSERMKEHLGGDVREQAMKHRKDGSLCHKELRIETESTLNTPVEPTESNQTKFEKATTSQLYKPSNRKRKSLNDGSTYKLERARLKAPKKPPKQSGHKYSDKSRLPNGILYVPANLKRPGYERRVRGLETIMERIVVEVLYTPGSEFSNLNATLHHVLLSPDGFNLKLYYDAENQLFLKDKDAYQLWSRRLCAKVRSALARGMYIKRVPKVKLVRIDGDWALHSSSIGRGYGKLEKLTELFGQIAAERGDDNDVLTALKTKPSSEG